MTSASAAPADDEVRSRAGSAVSRRGPLIAEIAVLAVLTIVDAIPLVGRPAHGLVDGVITSLVPGFGPVAAALAVARRRFVDRIGLLGGLVVALSLINTALTALAHETPHNSPGTAETLAIVLLLAAGCRRLAWRDAVVLSVAGGIAVTVAPVLRFGVGSTMALLAVPAALLWGVSLAVGLVLRDADDRRRAALVEARTAERLRLARELHDFVAHHVTGIVVRAQAARVLADRAGATAEVYQEIEEAGTDALAAMRRLVGMLRTDNAPEPEPAPNDLRAAILDAIDGHEEAVPDLSADLDRLTLTPEAITTVHRVVLEALTNVRRHAPEAGDVRVTARVHQEELIIDVANDGVRRTNEASGYGLIGMTERVTSLGGTLHAGPEPERRWRITVRLPLTPGGRPGSVGRGRPGGRPGSAGRGRNETS